MSEHVWLLDRCMGRHDVASALKAAGEQVQILDDHFPQTALDVEWLPVIGARGWLLITKDMKIRKRPSELEALKRARIGAFILSAKDLTGVQQGELLAGRLAQMERKADQFARPFVFTVSPSGDLSLVFGERRGGIRH